MSASGSYYTAHLYIRAHRHMALVTARQCGEARETKTTKIWLRSEQWGKRKKRSDVLRFVVFCLFFLTKMSVEVMRRFHPVQRFLPPSGVYGNLFIISIILINNRCCLSTSLLCCLTITSLEKLWFWVCKCKIVRRLGGGELCFFAGEHFQSVGSARHFGYVKVFFLYLQAHIHSE